MAAVPSGGSASGAAPLNSADTSRKEPERVTAARSVYTQKTNVTTNAPSGNADGVLTGVGRVWAEARSVTTSGSAAAVEVVLTATQNGARATVTAPSGQTISGGSVRFWVFDDENQRWSVGNVDETLPTGAQSVATTDLFTTVGAK